MPRPVRTHVLKISQHTSIDTIIKRSNFCKSEWLPS